MTLAGRATANLLATYLAVGRAYPGAEVRETPAYTALLSDLPHPSGNFAARLTLDPWSAAELKALAGARPAFQAVALPEDGPAHLAELLRRAGFNPVHRLVSMTASEPLSPPGERGRGEGRPSIATEVAGEGTPHPCPSPPEGRGVLRMTDCDTLEDRRQAARFMADAFFAREPAPLRAAMAEAVVATTSLSVHAYLLKDKPAAAVTLARHEGILGVYNLCVAPAHRGKGLGASLIRWCLAKAAAEGLPACLQCAPALEPWYTRHGFAPSGAIKMWSLGCCPRSSP